MARRSMVERLLADELLEMRLMRLPLDARYVWEHLVGIIARRGEAGILRIGSELGSELGFAGWFAHWFRRPETEIETHLETLHEARLLVVTTDAISLPSTAGAATRRAEQARINGAKGGRPPKRTQEQPSMPLTFGTKLAAVQNPPETEAETQTDPPHARELAASYSSSLEERAELAASCPKPAAEPKPEPPPTDPATLADELVLLLPGGEANRERDRAELVQAWLELGVTPEQMRLIIRQVTARQPVHTLRWFDAKMRAASTGPRVVRTQEPPAKPVGPPADPRVAHLPAQERSFAERVLVHLRQLEPVPEDPRQVGSDAMRSASFARQYCRPAFDAVARLYPQLWAWFGDEAPAIAVGATA